MRKLVLIGPPGSGKGTQAAYIKAHYNITHVSSGDVLRAEVARASDFGKQIKGYMDKGEIGPVELITEVMLQHLNTIRSMGFVLDGFPRTLYQAEKLAIQHNINVVFFIDVAVDKIVQRVNGRRICACGNIYHLDFNPPPRENFCKCGKELVMRSDDNEETVRNRIKVYNKETKPVIDFYQKNALLHTINGTNDPAHIFAEIKRIIN